MRNILVKEMKLSASVLSYLFIAFGLMFLLPGYPVLCGAFFLTLGIFQSFQNAVGSNDVVFSALLPIAKKDVVKGKYAFACFIELCGFLVMAAVTAVRMTALSGSAVYRENALMNANPFALGCASVVFGLFNCVFIGGFFKTGYRFGKPFVFYTAAAFLVILLAETLHHLPVLEALNAFGTDRLPLQLALLAGGIVCYLLLTLLSMRAACGRFEKIDL